MNALRVNVLYLSMAQQLYKPLTKTDIVSLRHELGWTQTVMAQCLKVTTRTIAYWEKGESQPNEYQLAALQFLRRRLQEAKNNQHATQFIEQLNQQLPAILFGIGIAALFVFLLSDSDDR